MVKFPQTPPDTVRDPGIPPSGLVPSKTLEPSKTKRTLSFDSDQIQVPQLPKVVCIAYGMFKTANAYLVQGDKGPVLLDTGMPGCADEILRRLDEDFGGAPLQGIWISHAHGDHYGNALEIQKRIKEKTGQHVPIAVHERDSQAMQNGKSPLGKTRGLGGRLVKALAGLAQRLHGVPAAEADLVLKDGDSLHKTFGLKAEVIHIPGHTPGSTCLIVNDKIAFIGDLAGYKKNGEISLQDMFADSWEDLTASARKLAALVEKRQIKLLYAGHATRPLNGKDFVDHVKSL